MEELELHLGIMNNKELAEWFGIAEGTFKNNKSDKLNILKQYANFEETKGKVNILEIKEPVFCGKTDKNYYLVKELFNKEWDKSGLDACQYVAQKILLHYPNKINLAESTIAKKVSDVRNELYGKPFEREGINIARCEYVWCKKVDMNGYSKCVRLTDREEKKRLEIYKKFFPNGEQQDVPNNELFKSYLFEVNYVLKCKLIKGTQLYEKVESAF